MNYIISGISKISNALGFEKKEDTSQKDCEWTDVHYEQTERSTPPIVTFTAIQNETGLADDDEPIDNEWVAIKTIPKDIKNIHPELQFDVDALKMLHHKPLCDDITKKIWINRRVIPYFQGLKLEQIDIEENYISFVWQGKIYVGGNLETPKDFGVITKHICITDITIAVTQNLIFLDI